MKKVLNPIRNQGSSKKVLITGIAGFAGSHLAEYLYSQKFTVFGFFLSNHLLLNLSHLKDKINLIECDLLDSKKVEKSVKLINRFLRIKPVILLRQPFVPITESRLIPPQK